VEGCNKELRQALAIAHWSSWAQLAFIPVGLVWVLGWALVKGVRGRQPQAGNEHYPQIANAKDNNEQHGKKDYFPAPWTVEKIADGFKVIDADGQSLAYVYSSENPHDAFVRKVLTEDEARRIASNIAKLPVLLGQARPDDSLEADGNLSDRRHEDEERS
jgi:hypothetical protein